MVRPALRIKGLYGFRDERRLLTLYVPYEWPRFSINILVYIISLLNIPIQTICSQ